jgi:predicted DNA-binding mobile mystery protein A
MPSSNLSRLRLSQLERAIKPFEVISVRSAPPGGWLRSIRESLGRSLRSQATLVSLAPTTLHKSELSEAEGRITLAQLRKLAAGLNCELVYALVPRQPLHEMVEARAESLARKEVMEVTHTMSLENQRPSDPFVERQVAARRQELLSGSWARLWR